MHAVSEERIGSVNLLLSKGANIKAVDNEGQTALFRAAIDDDSNYDWGGNYVEVTKVLLAIGANVNAKDEHGSTPLQKAIRNYNKESHQASPGKKVRTDLPVGDSGIKEHSVDRGRPSTRIACPIAIGSRAQTALKTTRSLTR